MQEKIINFEQYLNKKSNCDKNQTSYCEYAQKVYLEAFGQKLKEQPTTKEEALSIIKQCEIYIKNAYFTKGNNMTLLSKRKNRRR